MIMPRRPRILLDVDGPLTEGFWEETNAILGDMGYVVDARAARGWDVFKALGLSPGVEAVVRAKLRRPDVCRRFLPRAGSLEFVARLRAWAEVYACTSPLGEAPTWAYDRLKWLGLWFDIPTSRVISCDDKSVVGGDAFVDDRDTSLEAWQAEHPGGLAILWRLPHNVGTSWAGPAVSTYEELEEYLDALRQRA